MEEPDIESDSEKLCEHGAMWRNKLVSFGQGKHFKMVPYKDTNQLQIANAF